MKLAANRSSLSMTLLFCVGFITAGASADYGVVEATGAFQLPGTSTTTYVSEVGVLTNPRIQGFDFGQVLTGQTLLLQNFYFENYAYNNAGNGNGTNNFLNAQSTAILNVLIFQGTTLLSNTDYALKQTTINGNNRKWDMATGTNTNLAGGLANGDYKATFDVFYTYWEYDSNNNVSSNNASTGASTGNFSVLVPAPGAFALLGIAGLVSRRRRNELA